MGDTNVRLSLHNRLRAHLRKVNDIVANPLDYNAAKELLIRSEEIWKQFEEIQFRLISTALDDEAFKLQEKEGFKLEETYITLRSKLRPLIESLDPTAGRPVYSTALPNIKLPSIDIPTFSGNICEWTSFKDLFSAAVGSNAQLGAAQKLQYLKSSLEGEAASLIRYYAITDLNYSAAWKQLNDRYDNQREIVQTLINKLLNLREVKSESATDLQKLVDSFVECIRALEVLKRPTDQWDDFLVVILLNKLDLYTRREWAVKQTGTDLPKYKDLIDFLRSHVRGLLAAGGSVISSSNKFRERPIKVHMASADRSQCIICSGSHAQFQCPEMKRRSVYDRKGLVVQHRLCFNCLGTGHRLSSCSWNGTCRKCGKKHHTLLHSERTSRPTGRVPADKDARKEDKNADSEQVVSNHLVNVDTKGLLMTAVVNVTDKYGQLQPVRAFIDGGSQAEFISEECCRRLGLRRRYDNHEVKGFGGVHVGKARGAVQVTLQNRYNCEHAISFDMLVLSSLGDDMPSVKCKSGGWDHPKGLELADPCWHNPGSIDMVIGSQYLHKVLLTGRRLSKDEDAPVAWETVFGWVVSGKCVPEKRAVCAYHISVDPTDEILRRFWEVEDMPSEKHLTAEEQDCEQHFIKTHSRDTSGRFVVGVPFTDKKEKIGRTRDAAVKRLLQVERKLQRNPAFRQQYTDFMQEYEKLGHMVKVPDSESKEIPGKTAHLPHHGIVNESSSTTKMRVVFDGSAKSSTGISLNETMMVGAMLQEELYDLLLRFRIKLCESDADFHRIVWRNSPSEQIGDFKLTTVTYGTASAPNLATRCLHQLALDCSTTHPNASNALLRNTYIDDILAGASCKEKAVELFHELGEAVATAGLELRKWSSNDPDVLAVIPQSMRETEPLSFDDDQTIKALGVQWHPTSDSFRFKVVEFKYSENLTKRKLLSDASRVFDPLGLISCFSVRAKMLLQEVWKVDCGWDEEVPDHIEKMFTEYKVDLEKLTALSIPRRITVTSAIYEVHGFSDSSEKAFGAICYLRSISPDALNSYHHVHQLAR